MRILFTCFLLLFTYCSEAKANKYENCFASAEQDPELKTYPIAHSIAELKEQFEDNYQSQNRLKYRIYWDAKNKQYIQTIDNKNYFIPQNFITTIEKQITLSLKKGYADQVFYSDLGHAHIYFPEKTEFNLENLSSLLLLKKAKILYHTAELVKLREGDTLNGPLVPDFWLAWRYFTRNYIANNLDGKIYLLSLLKTKDITPYGLYLVILKNCKSE